MRTYLVAVVAESEQDIHRYLGPPGDGIDCWWVAEDDRQDGSDNDSAVFVPRGAQADAADLVRTWIDAQSDEWAQTGYPYAGTDVSGAWYPPLEDEWWKADQPGVVRQALTALSSNLARWKARP